MGDSLGDENFEIIGFCFKCRAGQSSRFMIYLYIPDKIESKPIVLLSSRFRQSCQVYCSVKIGSWLKEELLTATSAKTTRQCFKGFPQMGDNDNFSSLISKLKSNYFDNCSDCSNENRSP